jgi:multidrug efflux system membrane fusion protein
MQTDPPASEAVRTTRPLNHGDTALKTQIPSVDISQPPTKASSSARRKWVIVLLCALVVLGGVWVAWRRHRNASSLAAAARKETPAVTVVAGMAARKDVPIYLDGLGTVQAFNTVTVHVRVDGELKKVAFVEGQTVHVGDLLAQIDPAPYQAALGQSLAKKGQDEASLNLQRVELKREATLLAAKIDSQDTYDQVAAQVKELEAAVTADEAAIDNTRVQLAYTTLTSPIDGRVGIRLVDVGNIVHATDSNGLVVITQLHPISVIFTLPEQTLSGIQQSQTAGDLGVLAVAGDNGKVLDSGSLAVIDNEIDSTTGTIRLKANFPNRDLQLWPGQFVNTRLLLTTRTNGIVVPASVIQRGPAGPYAFVIEDDLSVKIQPVKVAQTEDGQALIDEGLQPGQRVVVDGQYKLQVGSHVRLGGQAKADGGGAGADAPSP